MTIIPDARVEYVLIVVLGSGNTFRRNPVHPRYIQDQIKGALTVRTSPA
jgi:hypothetical protein